MIKVILLQIIIYIVVLLQKSLNTTGITKCKIFIVIIVVGANDAVSNGCKIVSHSSRIL